MKKIIASNPKLAAPHQKLGDIYQKLGQSDDAIAEYKRALEISPELKEALRSIEDTYRRKEQQAKTKRP